MKNLRAFAVLVPALMLSGCPLYIDDGGDPPPGECSSDFECGADERCASGTCVPTGPRCESDSECGADELCIAETCRPGTTRCREAADCASDELCSDGVCTPTVPRCGSDSDCGAGQLCDDGTCRPGTTRCTDGMDCASDEVCNAGICEPAPDNSCRTHGDCASGSYCDDAGECAPSGNCTDDAGCASFAGYWCDFRDTCVPHDDGACRSVTDCAGEDVCVEGVCRDRDDTCQFDRECSPGTVCLNNECTRVCTAPTDCVSGDSCQGNFCRPDATECTSSASCASGENCVDGRCLPDCEASGVCTETGSYCAEDAFCHPEWDEEPFCTMDSDCNTGRVCRSSVCRTPCPAPNNTNAYCMGFDSQVPECRQDAVTDEFLCHATNELTPECTVASDCGADRDCLDGACRNR